MRCCAAGALALGAVLAFAPIGASARTATFSSSSPLSPTDISSLSTAGDNAGPLVSVGQWIALLFSQPFGVSKSDDVAIFTVAPPVGNARLSVSFGFYNNGSPIFVTTRQVNAGNSLNIGNLFQQGCSAFGGCDYIFITTDRQRQQALGVTVDYVSINGEVTQVAAPTPEPAAWMLMILGFGAVALRLKARRKPAPAIA